MARKLIVEIIGDASSLEREFKRSASGAKQFERTIGQIGRGTVGGVFSSMGRQVAFASGGFLGAAGLVTGMKASVTAASDLNEEMSKSRQVFGGSSAAVRAWARQAPEALKTSQREALAAASGFGTMLETAGLAQSEAADMSVTMTRLGADMASFNNEDPSEMLDRLRSGLAGEAEPLRRFGVLLSESRVAQEAVRMGLASSTKHLTEQQKVLARYSIILRDTAKQQGDVARTGDQFAGQQRELRARLEETAAVLGTKMLPAVTDITEQLNKWLANPENTDRFADGIGRAATNAQKLAKHAGDTFDFLSRIANLKFNDPPSWFDQQQRRLNQWRAGVAGPFVFGPFSGAIVEPNQILDQAGGGDFGTAGGLRPDDRAGPFGPGPGRPTRAAVRAATAAQPPGVRTPFLSYRLALAEATKARRDDERVLGQIIGVLRTRLGATKNLKARTQIQEALNQYQGQLSGLLDEDAQVVKDAAARAKEARQRQRERAQEAARLAREARMVYETPLGLQLAEARAGATGRGTRSALVEIRKAARRALRSGNLLVQGQIDAWNVIASANQRLADMNKSRTSRMITAYHATTAAMAHGGQQPNAGAAGVLGQPLILQLDGRTIATAVVPHIQRSAKRSTATTTGRSAGTVHGI